jgi:hypothetical protein
LFAARALADGGSGTVAAARRGVAFVQMGSGPLLAFLPRGTPIHPWALSVSIDPSTLTQGTQVRVGRGVLAIGSNLIPLGEAKTVGLCIPRRPRDLPVRTMRLVVDLKVHRPDSGPFDSACSKGLAHFGSGGNPDGLTRILGIGKGFTPSGDDTLVGALAGLDLVQRASPAAARDRRALVAFLLPQLEEGTSRFSASLILAAAAGHYAEPILSVLRIVGRSNATAASLDAACAALLDVGHDSGAFILEGIRAAFSRTLLSIPTAP